MNFDIPNQFFPVCHVSEENEETRSNLKNNYSHDFNQRLNQIEYGKLSGFILTKDGQLYFRNLGRDCIVHYDSCCLPLLPPNITTPFEYNIDLHLHPKVEQMLKQKVDDNFRYFKYNFHQTYVTLNPLIDHINETLTLDYETEELEPNQSSIITFVPCWSSQHLDHITQKLEGYLIFATGPNMNEITIAVLTNHLEEEQIKGVYSSYTNYIEQNGLIKLSCAEVYQMPGRIRQIVAAPLQGKVLVAVRCNYFIGFFEGPSESTEHQIKKKWQWSTIMSSSPVNLLKPIQLFQLSVLTSTICLCPYYFGEAVFVTETGGLYLWDNEAGVTQIQFPLSLPSATSEPAHVWWCVYGPHGRSVVISELNCVSLVDFKDKPIYKTILKHGDRYLITKWVVSSLAKHPLHPFYIFIATTDKVLLYDLRQPHEPLLEIRHELPELIRYMDVVCCPWQQDETFLMMSSLHGAHCHVIAMKGGYAIKEGQTILPPHISLTTHTVDSYKNICEDLNLSSPLLNWRLTQRLAGACFIPLTSSQHFCAVIVSFLGDCFYQCWHYGVPPTASPVVPFLPPECGIWAEEIIQLEKEAQRLVEIARVEPVSKWDFNVLLKYTLSSLAEKGLCLYCCTLLEEGMECGDVEKITGPHPPCNGLNAQWKCNLCLTTVYTQDILRIKNHIDYPEGTTGMDILQEMTKGGSCPSDYEEICRLWKLWDETDKKETHEREEELNTSQMTPTKEILLQGAVTSQETSNNSPVKKKKSRKVGF